VLLLLALLADLVAVLPWWWEWDILAAIESVERQIALKPVQGVATHVGGLAR